MPKPGERNSQTKGQEQRRGDNDDRGIEAGHCYHGAPKCQKGDDKREKAQRRKAYVESDGEEAGSASCKCVPNEAWYVLAEYRQMTVLPAHSLKPLPLGSRRRHTCHPSSNTKQGFIP